MYLVGTPQHGQALKVGGSHEGKAPYFARGHFFRKSFAVLSPWPFFAVALSRGICPRQDRPHYRLVLKLNHGVDEQDGCIRFCLVQSPLGVFYTTHLNRPQHSLQNHYD